MSLNVHSKWGEGRHVKGGGVMNVKKVRYYSEKYTEGEGGR